MLPNLLFPNRLFRPLMLKIEIMFYLIVRTLRHSVNVYLVQKHGNHSPNGLICPNGQMGPRMNKEGRGREDGRGKVYSPPRYRPEHIFEMTKLTFGPLPLPLWHPFLPFGTFRFWFPDTWTFTFP